MISATPMHARYLFPALLAALLLSLGTLPAAARAQSDTDAADEVKESADSAEESSDEASASGAGDEAANDYSDSEPTLDDEEEEEDEELDEEADEDVAAASAAPPPLPDEAFADELPQTPKGVFAGKLTIALFGGFGLRLAGDKTINPFAIGLSPENNTANYGGAMADPMMMMVAPPPPTVFDRGQAVMDSYAQRDLILEPKPNPFGTSFGLRAGYTLPEDPLYVGLVFNYFSGGKLTVPHLDVPAEGVTPAVINPTITSASSVILIGAEAGLEWDLTNFLVLRPVVGIGAGVASTKMCLNGEQVTDETTMTTRTQNACESASTTRVLLMPGLSAIVPIDMFFVSAEGRFIGLSGAGGQASFYLGGTAGVALEL